MVSPNTQPRMTGIPTEWGEDKNWCAGCERPVLKAEFPENSPYCFKCRERLSAVIEHRHIAAGLAQVGRTVAEYGEKSQKCRVEAASIIGEFVELQGGAAKLGRVLHQKFEMAMTDPLVPLKEQRQWISRFMGMIQKQEMIDAAREQNHSGISDEELITAAKSLAIELVRDDPAFRHEVMRAAGLTVLEQSADG